MIYIVMILEVVNYLQILELMMIDNAVLFVLDHSLWEPNA